MLRLALQSAFSSRENLASDSTVTARQSIVCACQAHQRNIFSSCTVPDCAKHVHLC